MTRFAKNIRVVANPHHVLDHKGRPACTVAVEPKGAGVHLGYVGAKIDRANTKASRVKSKGDIREPRQDTTFLFSPDPVTLLGTPYYRDALRTGALLPADEATAKWAGLDFKPVSEALELARKKAEADFDSLYGEGSLAAVRGIDAEQPSEANSAESAEPTSPGASDAPRDEEPSGFSSDVDAPEFETSNDDDGESRGADSQ
jgi:hypothetical protein